MKRLRNFVLGIAFLSVMFINVNAETEVTSQEIKPNSPLSTTTVVVDNATYIFNEVGPDIWQHASSDVVNGGAHTLTKYEYAENTKPCATITPTEAEIRGNENMFIAACSRKKTENTYLGTDTKYPTVEKKFTNGKLTSQMQYLRDAAKRIKEARDYRYHSNGKVNKYTRYYGGRKISADKVSYNKTYISNKNAKGQTTSLYYYELSQLWNERKANVPVKTVKYSYYANGKIKQRYTYYKSVKYNTYSQKQFLSYYSNGKKKQYILNKYNYQGKMTKKI